MKRLGNKKNENSHWYKCHCLWDIFNGKPRELLRECFNRKYKIICTKEILLEYVETIEKLTKKYKQRAREEIIPILLDNITIIENVDDGKYSRDPDDDKFINCAKSSGVKYVITGDNDLLVLEKIGDIRLLTVADFLKEKENKS